MLDFYIISDEQDYPNPEDVDQLKYVGGIDSDVYRRLVKKDIIDSRFDYYSDFRWSLAIVNQIKQKIDKSDCASSDTDIKQLHKILKEALLNEHGLVAYGD